MRLAAGILLLVLAASAGNACGAEAAAKPKNMAEMLGGKWTGKTPKGNFELNFNEKGEFASGHFFNFPLKSCKIKSVSPFEFEVVYAIEKMNGMTVTVQFKDGQFSPGFRTITGKFNTMLDKGEYSMTKQDVMAAGTKKTGEKAAQK